MKSFYIDILITKFRTQIMGIAIILIMLSHSVVKKSGWHWGDTFLLDFGVIGVDLFLLVSGFGLYYSMMKTNGIKSFYRKRLMRILPEYWIVIFLYHIISFLSCDYDIRLLYDLVTELTTLGFWLSIFHYSDPYWYISGILFLYIVSPFLIKEVDNNWKRIFFFVLLFSFFITFVNASFVHGYYYLLSARFPIFVIGLILGKYSYNGLHVQLSDKWAFIGFSFFVILLLLCKDFQQLIHFALRYGFVFFIFILIIPSIILIICYLDKHKVTSNMLTYLGGLSLELYLCHGLLYRLLKLFEIEHNVFSSVILFIGSIPLAIILKKSISIKLI